MAPCCHQGRSVPAEWGHLLRAKTTAAASPHRSCLPRVGSLQHCQHIPVPASTPWHCHSPSQHRPRQSPPGPPAPSSPAAPALHTPCFSDSRTGKMLLLRSCYLDMSPQAEPGQGDTSVTSLTDSRARCAPSSLSIPRAGSTFPTPRHEDKAERSPVNTHSPRQAEGFGIEEQRAPPAPTGLQPQDVSLASPAPAGGSAPIASSVLPAKVRAR